MGRREHRQAKELKAKGLPVKKEAVYNITDSQLKATIAKEMETYRKSVIQEVTEVVSTLYQLYSFLVLHDKFGFGKERCLRFKRELEEVSDSVMKDYITNGDVATTCAEFGINVSDSMLEFLGEKRTANLSEKDPI